MYLNVLKAVFMFMFEVGKERTDLTGKNPILLNIDVVFL